MLVDLTASYPDIKPRAFRLHICITRDNEVLFMSLQNSLVFVFDYSAYKQSRNQNFLL